MIFQPSKQLWFEKPPNTACTGRLGLGAFLGVVSELWQFPVSKPVSPQPPVTQAVRQLYDLLFEISFF